MVQVPELEGTQEVEGEAFQMVPPGRGIGGQAAGGAAQAEEGQAGPPELGLGRIPVGGPQQVQEEAQPRLRAGIRQQGGQSAGHDAGLQAQEVVQHMVTPAVMEVDQADGPGFRIHHDIVQVEITVDGADGQLAGMVQERVETQQGVGQYRSTQGVGQEGGIQVRRGGAKGLLRPLPQDLPGQQSGIAAGAEAAQLRLGLLPEVAQLHQEPPLQQLDDLRLSDPGQDLSQAVHREEPGPHQAVAQGRALTAAYGRPPDLGHPGEAAADVVLVGPVLPLDTLRTVQLEYCGQLPVAHPSLRVNQEDSAAGEAAAQLGRNRQSLVAGECQPQELPFGDGQGQLRRVDEAGKVGGFWRHDWRQAYSSAKHPSGISEASGSVRRRRVSWHRRQRSPS